MPKVKSKSYWSARRHVVALVDAHMTEMDEEINSCITSEESACDELFHLVTNKKLSEHNDLSDHSDDGHQDDYYNFSDGNDSDDVSDISSLLSDFDVSDDDLSKLLAEWAVSFNISLTALGQLLSLLHKYHPSLPIDARTVLQTPRSTAVKQLSDGEYYHFGITHNLQNILAGSSLEIFQNEDILKVQLNIDGLPIFKSSGLQLWPILGMLKSPCESKPFTIGVYAGNKKPGNLSEFLADLINEVLELEGVGLQIQGRVFQVQIHSFVCDAPARSMLKGTKGHTAYHGCDRCTQHGVWKGKMTYPETNASLRTDVAFDELLDSDHHRVKSPLSALKIGMVSQFCLDYMHLICLGILKRLILLWMRGPLTCRLSASVIGQISEHLIHMRSLIPSEFARRPRSLYDIDRWKATELRQFLLYTGPISLLHLLGDKHYKHFMLLSVGMYCCLNSKLCHHYADYVQKLFVLFVQQGAELYGQEFMVYNVHSLVHLVDDVRLFGALDNISAFPFENHLRLLKTVYTQTSNATSATNRSYIRKRKL
jgi:hypothetical protein